MFDWLLPTKNNSSSSAADWWCLPLLWYHRLQDEFSILGRPGGRATMSTLGWMRCCGVSLCLLSLLVASYILCVVILLYFLMIALGPTLLLWALYIEPVLIVRNLLQLAYTTEAMEVPILRLRTFERVGMNHVVEKYVTWFYQPPNTENKEGNTNNHDTDEDDDDDIDIDINDILSENHSDDDDPYSAPPSPPASRPIYYEYESSYKEYDQARKAKRAAVEEDYEDEEEDSSHRSHSNRSYRTDSASVSLLVLPDYPASGRPAVALPKLVQKSKHIQLVCFAIGCIIFTLRTSTMVNSNYLECQTLGGFIDLRESEIEHYQTYEDSLFNYSSWFNNSKWMTNETQQVLQNMTASLRNQANKNPFAIENNDLYDAEPAGIFTSVISLIERVLTWNVMTEKCAFYQSAKHHPHTSLIIWIILSFVEFLIALPFAYIVYGYRKIVLLNASKLSKETNNPIQDYFNNHHNNYSSKSSSSSRPRGVPRFSVELTSIQKANDDDDDQGGMMVQPPLSHHFATGEDPFALLDDDDEEDDEQQDTTNNNNNNANRILSKIHPKYRQHQAISTNEGIV